VHRNASRAIPAAKPIAVNNLLTRLLMMHLSNKVAGKIDGPFLKTADPCVFLLGSDGFGNEVAQARNKSL